MSMHPHIASLLAAEHVKEMRAQAAAARRAREARRARRGSDLLTALPGTQIFSAQASRQRTAACEPTCA